MEGWSLNSGTFRALEMAGSMTWDCSGLSQQQAAPCQCLSALAISASCWPCLWLWAQQRVRGRVLQRVLQGKLALLPAAWAAAPSGLVSPRQVS